MDGESRKKQTGYNRDKEFKGKKITSSSRKKGVKCTRKEMESLLSDLQILESSYRGNPQNKACYGHKQNARVISLDILKVNSWMTEARGWN